MERQRARPRVVHVTSVHRSDDPRISLKECGTLAAAGYEVVLVAPDRGIPPPTGVRLQTVPSRRGRVRRMSRTVWDVYRAALAEQADVYHFHDPELIPVGLAIKLLHRRTVVYDVHEDVPRQILGKPWLPRPARPIVGRIVELIEMLAARVFDATVTATPEIARRFPAGRTVTVQNFPIMEEVAESADRRPYVTRPRLISYIGRITIAAGALEMVAAFERLPRELDVRFVMAGVVAEELESRRSSLAAPGVELPGWLDRRKVAELLAESRLGLVVLHPLPNYLESYPTKLFEYMAAGIPVVASDFPLWRRIVEEASCGILVEPRDVGSIAAAIGALLEDPRKAEQMGRRGQTAVRDRYQWGGEADKLVELYSSRLAPLPER